MPASRATQRVMKGSWGYLMREGDLAGGRRRSSELQRGLCALAGESARPVVLRVTVTVGYERATSLRRCAAGPCLAPSGSLRRRAAAQPATGGSGHM